MSVTFHLPIPTHDALGAVPPAFDEPPVLPVSGDERRHRELLDALSLLGEQVSEALDVPTVTAPAPTLPPAVEPGALADAIARALSAMLTAQNDQTLAALKEVTENLTKLRKVTVASATSGGGVGTSGHVVVDSGSLALSEPVTIAGPVTVSGVASETTLLDVKRARTDQRVLFDYAGRIDSNAVYVGKALQSTATSSAVWQVQRISYDATARATDVQVLVGAWDNRATLGWS